jgi:hypothetical protein
VPNRFIIRAICYITGGKQQAERKIKYDGEKCWDSRFFFLLFMGRNRKILMDTNIRLVEE